MQDLVDDLTDGESFLCDWFENSLKERLEFGTFISNDVSILGTASCNPIMDSRSVGVHWVREFTATGHLEEDEAADPHVRSPGVGLSAHALRWGVCFLRTLIFYRAY